ncbi:MAG: galactokinase [Oscillospiraceae bacterium]
MDYIQELKDKLSGGAYDGTFSHLYGKEQAEKQAARLSGLADKFQELYGQPEQSLRIFSAPGRTEIGGNHTDHQNGRVLAASINLDTVGIACKNAENIVRIQSVGYKQDVVDLGDLEIKETEKNKAISVIRGVCARMKALGYTVGGFDVYTTSDVPGGSGLSSSAAFENLIATTMNYLYNDGKIDAVTIAQIGQYAENNYFGKPSGLLDQGTSAVGGFVTIDFEDTQKPVVEPVDFDFAGSGHALCVVTTDSDHSDLTDEYAAVSWEMGSVAAYFGKEKLRGVDPAEFYSKLPQVREKVGDRAVLRAMHFFGDNDRVPLQVEALRAENFELFKVLVIESGRSSYMQLQNVYSTKTPQQQGLSLALSLSEKLLSPVGGAWRVHGGGFAGTIMAFVPDNALEHYRSYMESVFGEGACQVLSVRPVGAVEITAN